MVSEHTRYLRDQKSQFDKQQSKFTQTGWLKPTEPEVKVEFTAANSNEQVMCPFCLHTDKLSLFFIFTHKGISQGKAQCPECKNTMMMKSLWNDWGATEYAIWVFGYRQSGFWKKCLFDVWKKRLYKIGWAPTFWAKYKSLKGEEGADAEFARSDKTAQDYEEDYAAYEASQQ